ncbi:c-type cytochrome [Sulfurimonas sp. HSL3-7]|uniref:c-type cytochrome n=1 Tax=Sulfonitrofixus jiaomeiensis TaxID=3131938 RepID=UPI0031F7F8D5
MKRSITVFAFAAILTTNAFGGEPSKGEALFDAKCAACHIKTRPTPEKKKGLTAPPAMGVMFHVKAAFSDRKAATAFVSDYALNPSEKKAKCLPRSIRRFGVMPSQKGAVTEAELSLIADYLYDNFPSKGFRHSR